MVAETSGAKKKVREKQIEAASLDEEGRSTSRREIQSEIAALLSHQSLAEWTPFLKDLCVEDGVVVEDVDSIVTYKLF